MLIELDLGISSSDTNLQWMVFGNQQTDSLKEKKISWWNSAMPIAIYINGTFVPIVIKSIDKKQVILSPF